MNFINTTVEHFKTHQIIENSIYDYEIQVGDILTIGDIHYVCCERVSCGSSEQFVSVEDIEEKSVQARCYSCLELCYLENLKPNKLGNLVCPSCRD